MSDITNPFSSTLSYVALGAAFVVGTAATAVLFITGRGVSNADARASERHTQDMKNSQELHEKTCRKVDLEIKALEQDLTL